MDFIMVEEILWTRVWRWMPESVTWPWPTFPSISSSSIAMPSRSINSALLPCGLLTTYLPAVWGLGGRDVTVEDQVGLFEDLREFHEGGQIQAGKNKLIAGTLWVGLK